MHNRPKLGYKIKNLSKPEPVNATEAKMIANREIFLRQFKPDCAMVLKRISNAPTGLRFGGPMGFAT